MKKPRRPAPQRPAGKALKDAIVRSVASSTALETGQSIEQLERALRAPTGKFRHLKLAR